MTENRIDLVAFDMEGCLTADPTVWEIMHRKLGTWESHGLVYWNRYQAGGIEYDDFARMDVAVWKGSPLSLLLEAVEEVPLMTGCEELFGALSEAGISVAVITNGLACVAERFARMFKVEHIFANRVVSDGDRLTGEVDIRVPYHGKGEVLSALAAQLGIEQRKIAAVGDSTSDIAMFESARVGVAFRPSHPRVAEAATHVVPDGDLRAVLPMILG